MQIFVILALLIIVAVIILLLQNMSAVTITIYLWSVHTSLAVALLIALAVGVLITLLLIAPGSVHNKMSISGYKKKLVSLEEDRNKFHKKAEDAEKEVTKLEEQLASFSAALGEKLGDPGVSKSE